MHEINHTCYLTVTSSYSLNIPRMHIPEHKDHDLVFRPSPESCVYARVLHQTPVFLLRLLYCHNCYCIFSVVKEGQATPRFSM